ncbi:MAG: WXG100 family type VII secretion target [Mycobacterium sp.]
MPEAFRVDPEALADAVERMSEFQRFAESLLPEIDSLVTHLHDTWAGQAADAHAEAHRHWTRGAAMMHEALRQLHGAGTTAHHNYTRAMATNTSMWS